MTIVAAAILCAALSLPSCNTEQKEAPDERSIEGDTNENEPGLNNANDTTETANQ